MFFVEDLLCPLVSGRKEEVDVPHLEKLVLYCHQIVTSQSI